MGHKRISVPQDMGMYRLTTVTEFGKSVPIVLKRLTTRGKRTKLRIRESSSTSSIVAKLIPISGLRKQSTYRYRIKAVTTDYSSPWVESEVFTKDNTPPLIPTALQAKAI